MKKVLIIVGIVIAVLIVIGLVLPALVNANRYKPTLESDLSTALGRKVDIGNIQLAIFSGGVQVDNVTIADDPAFSSSPFLSAKQLTAGVSLLPLIFSKKLEVRSFTITDPQVQLLRSASGTWNFSSLGTNASKPPSTPTPSNSPAGAAPAANSSSSASNFSVGKFKLSNGTLVVGRSGKTQSYQDVNLEASNLSYTSQFPFKLTLKTPGGGTVSLDGNAGPVDSTDASLTPFHAKLDAQHVDIGATGFVDASAGFAGIVSFTGDLSSDGHQASSQGTVKTEKIKLVAGGSPSNVPVNLGYDTDYDLKAQTGTLKQGDVHIGKALAHLTGTFNMSGPATTVQMKLDGQAMPVTDLQGVLPAAGVVLPSGASLQSGTVNVTLALNGPVDKLVITGPVNLSNGKMEGFSLKQKLGALSSFTGLGGNSGSSTSTEIQTFSANVRQDPEGTHADNVDLVVPTIGTVTGTANVSSAGKLDCQMVAKLSAGGAGPAGSATSALSSFTGGGKSQGGGIPFKVQGTTSSPIFIPDVGAMAKGMLKSGSGASSGAASSAQSALGGLFGKKK